MGGYWCRYADIYFTLIIFGALVQIIHWKNGCCSINMKNYHNCFPHLVQYGYHCTTEPSIYFYWQILVQLYLYIFHITQIRCLGVDKTLEKWLLLHKYEELPQYFSPILQSMEIVVPQSLQYIFIGRFWSSYTYIYFTLLIFGVLVILKQQGYGCSFINMENYHNIFHPYCRVYMVLSHISFAVIFVKYWLIYDNIYFILL